MYGVRGMHRCSLQDNRTEKGYYEDLEDNIKINLGERLGCGHHMIVFWECVNDLSFNAANFSGG
jgi:hypothetical protein